MTQQSLVILVDSGSVESEMCRGSMHLWSVALRVLSLPSTLCGCMPDAYIGGLMYNSVAGVTRWSNDEVHGRDFGSNLSQRCR